MVRAVEKATVGVAIVAVSWAEEEHTAAAAREVVVQVVVAAANAAAAMARVVAGRVAKVAAGWAAVAVAVVPEATAG